MQQARREVYQLQRDLDHIVREQASAKARVEESETNCGELKLQLNGSQHMLEVADRKIAALKTREQELIDRCNFLMEEVVEVEGLGAKSGTDASVPDAKKDGTNELSLRGKKRRAQSV